VINPCKGDAKGWLGHGSMPMQLLKLDEVGGWMSLNIHAPAFLPIGASWCMTKIYADFISFWLVKWATSPFQTGKWAPFVGCWLSYLPVQLGSSHTKTQTKLGHSMRRHDILKEQHDMSESPHGEVCGVTCHNQSLSGSTNCWDGEPEDHSQFAECTACSRAQFPVAASCNVHGS